LLIKYIIDYLIFGVLINFIVIIQRLDVGVDGQKRVDVGVDGLKNDFY